MAPTKNPRVRLRHIQDEIRQISAALTGTTCESFEQDYLRRRAAQHAVMIVSEAVRALPEDLLSQHPQVDWRQIRAIGNRLRHEYERVDPVIIWDVVHHDFRVLGSVVDAMLADSSQERSEDIAPDRIEP